MVKKNGRSTILPAGGVDSSNEIYTSQEAMIKYWAETKGCDMNSMKRIVTPNDNAEERRFKKRYNLLCLQYTKGCSG